MKNLKLSTIYIVRHGESQSNVDEILAGHYDSPLTPTGENQARETARILHDVKFDAVFSSDLVRAKRTAEIIVLEKKLAVTATKVLRERSYGIYENKPYTKINSAIAKLLVKYKHLNEDERNLIPLSGGVETIQNVISRFITFLRVVSIGYSGKTILIVCHGGLMRSLLIHLGFATFKTLPPGSISNAGYIKLESDGIDFFVKETKGISVVK